MSYSIIFPAEKLANEKSVSFEVADAYLKYKARVELKNRRGGRAGFKDSAKSKTYRAESLFKYRNGGYGPTITIEQAREISNEIFESAVWNKHKTEEASHTAPFMKYNARTTQWDGIAYYNYIELSRCGMNMYTLLHELAHTAGHRHHDVSFRRCLVDFVAVYMGKESAKILKKCFVERGLKMKQRAAKPPMEFDAWYTKYQRLQKARAKKNK